MSRIAGWTATQVPEQLPSLIAHTLTLPLRVHQPRIMRQLPQLRQGSVVDQGKLR